ncbi:MAG: hypothetical protein HXX16_16905 [Bacteroidales bacterium]|nr:hypothetical protein [Bacteroidales bacterium]
MLTQFNVNADSITNFAEVLVDNEMENRIVGTTDDGGLLIEVEYTKNDRDVIEELEDISEPDEDE